MFCCFRGGSSSRPLGVSEAAPVRALAEDVAKEAPKPAQKASEADKPLESFERSQGKKGSTPSVTGALTTFDGGNVSGVSTLRHGLATLQGPWLTRLQASAEGLQNNGLATHVTIFGASPCGSTLVAFGSSSICAPEAVLPAGFVLPVPWLHPASASRRRDGGPGGLPEGASAALSRDLLDLGTLGRVLVPCGYPVLRWQVPDFPVHLPDGPPPPSAVNQPDPNGVTNGGFSKLPAEWHRIIFELSSDMQLAGVGQSAAEEGPSAAGYATPGGRPARPPPSPSAGAGGLMPGGLRRRVDSLSGVQRPTAALVPMLLGAQLVGAILLLLPQSCPPEDSAEGPAAPLGAQGSLGSARAPLGPGPGAGVGARPRPLGAGPGVSGGLLGQACYTGEEGSLGQVAAAVAECCVGPHLSEIARLAAAARDLAAAPDVQSVASVLSSAVTDVLAYESHVDFTARLALVPQVYGGSHGNTMYGFMLTEQAGGAGGGGGGLLGASSMARGSARPFTGPAGAERVMGAASASRGGHSPDPWATPSGGFTAAASGLHSLQLPHLLSVTGAAAGGAAGAESHTIRAWKARPFALDATLLASLAARASRSAGPGATGNTGTGTGTGTCTGGGATGHSAGTTTGGGSATATSAAHVVLGNSSVYGGVEDHGLSLAMITGLRSTVPVGGLCSFNASSAFALGGGGAGGAAGGGGGSARVGGTVIPAVHAYVNDTEQPSGDVVLLFRPGGGAGGGGASNRHAQNHLLSSVASVNAAGPASLVLVAGCVALDVSYSGDLTAPPPPPQPPGNRSRPATGSGMGTPPQPMASGGASQPSGWTHWAPGFNVGLGGGNGEVSVCVALYLTSAERLPMSLLLAARNRAQQLLELLLPSAGYALSDAAYAELQYMCDAVNGTALLSTTHLPALPPAAAPGPAVSGGGGGRVAGGVSLPASRSTLRHPWSPSARQSEEPSWIGGSTGGVSLSAATASGAAAVAAAAGGAGAAAGTCLMAFPETDSQTASAGPYSGAREKEPAGAAGVAGSAWTPVMVNTQGLGLTGREASETARSTLTRSRLSNASGQPMSPGSGGAAAVQGPAASQLPTGGAANVSPSLLLSSHNSLVGSLMPTATSVRTGDAAIAAAAAAMAAAAKDPSTATNEHLNLQLTPLEGPTPPATQSLAKVSQRPGVGPLPTLSPQASLSQGHSLHSHVSLPHGANLLQTQPSIGGSAYLSTQRLSGRVRDPPRRQTSDLINTMPLDVSDTLTVMRTNMDILVSSFWNTLRSQTNEANPSAHADEDLRFLRLMKIVGHGGCSVVYAGLLHGLEVAVKVMHADGGEMDAEEEDGAGGHDTQGGAAGTDGEAHPSPAARQAALRALMRGARELAVMTSLSHPNIVQIYSYHTRVLVKQPSEVGGQEPGQALDQELPRLVPAPPGDQPSSAVLSAPSPLQTVLIMECCDLGSLADALDSGMFGSAIQRAEAARWRPGPPRRSATFSQLPTIPARASVTHGGGGPGPGPGPGEAAAAAGQGGAFGSANLAQPTATSRATVRAGSTAGGGMRAIYLTLLEVALALRHMHSMQLVHCDVKPANVLLKSSPSDPRGFTCKLTDFGFVNLLQYQHEDADDPQARPSMRYHEPVGTVTHLAPETMVQGSRLDHSVDVYAFGVLMWEVFTGKAPYAEHAASNFREVPYRVVREGMRPAFPSSTPPAYRTLAQTCWSHDPARRPTAAALVATLQRLMEASAPR